MFTEFDVEQATDRFGGNREAGVSYLCRKELLDAGLREVGQRVRVLFGRYRGLEGEVTCINWSEAEIQMKGGVGRWFDVRYVLVLDPRRDEVDPADTGRLRGGPGDEVGMERPVRQSERRRKEEVIGWVPGM